MADDSGRHVDHDPLVVAALLDDETPPVERTAAEARIRDCAECAALHADLLALASATRGLPVPPRPRDFRLSAADAARLVTPGVGEPSTPTARLTREMTATHTASAHASHDTMLVASLADHSLAASEREAAEALIAACGLCAALHADLVALVAATRAMPTPPRPRDYTLTAEDAARLHPSGWRRWVAAFGTSRDAFSRPLAVGLTTLGLAGLLVATIPSVPSVLMQGSATSGAAERDAAVPSGAAVAAPGFASAAPPMGAAGAPSVGDVGMAASPQPVPVNSPNRLVDEPDRAASAPPVQGALGSGSSKGADGGVGRTNDVPAGDAVGGAPLDEAAGIPALILVSGALLIVGLGLFLMRWAARRFGD